MKIFLFYKGFCVFSAKLKAHWNILFEKIVGTIFTTFYHNILKLQHIKVSLWLLQSSLASIKRAFKEFVAQKGKPQMLVSDNGKTFVKSSKCIATSKNKEDIVNYNGNYNIIWKFNFSRAPWFCEVGFLSV